MEINVVIKTVQFKVLAKKGQKYLQNLGKSEVNGGEVRKKEDEEQLASDFIRQAAIEVAEFNEKEQLIAMEIHKVGKVAHITQKYVE